MQTALNSKEAQQISHSSSRNKFKQADDELDILALLSESLIY